MRKHFGKILFSVLIVIIVLLIILLFSRRASANMITGNVIDEEIYGENIVRIHQEAQILWVRETFITVFDYEAGKNKPVSMMSDDKILQVLKNHQSKLQLNMEEVDFTPYVERVQGKEPNIEQPSVVEEERVPHVEESPVIESKKIIKKYVPFSEASEEKPMHVEQPRQICKLSFNPFSFKVELPIQIKPLFLC